MDRTALRPAYLFDGIGLTNPSLRNIEVLDWMVSELPSTDEVAVALNAVGALEFESHHPLWGMGYRDLPMPAPALRLGEAILDRAKEPNLISDAEQSLLLRSLILTGPCNDDARGSRWLFTLVPGFTGLHSSKEHDAFPLYAALRCVSDSHSRETIATIGEVGQQMMRWSTEGMPGPVMLPSTLACLVGVIESRDEDNRDWLTAITIAQYAELAASSQTKHQTQTFSKAAEGVLIRAGVESRLLGTAAVTLWKPPNVWDIALESLERLGLEPTSRSAIVRAYLATLSQGETTSTDLRWDQVVERLSFMIASSEKAIFWPRTAVVQATDLLCRGLRHRRRGHWSSRVVPILHTLLEQHQKQSLDPQQLIKSTLSSFTYSLDEHSKIAAETITGNTHPGSAWELTDTVLNVLLPIPVLSGSGVNLLQPDAPSGSSGETTIWQLLVTTWSGEHATKLLRAARGLILRLRFLSATQCNSSQIERLLHAIAGDGRAVAMLSRSRGSPANAFQLARHIMDIAPDWWKSVLRPALQKLQPNEWDVDWNVGSSRWDGSKAFVQAVDDAPPCEDCILECAKLLQRHAALAEAPGRTLEVTDPTSPPGDGVATFETGELPTLSSDVRDVSRAEQLSPGEGSST